MIYGKPGHAEVIGLIGQTRNEAIVVMEEKDLDQIDWSRPIILYSQTTKSTQGFYHMKSLIQARIEKEKGTLIDGDFKANDSICRQVSNREPQLEKFSQSYDVILFVSGKKSSNGKALYQVCLKQNPRSYFIDNESEIDHEWLKTGDRIGICGATSTPNWLMQQVADHLSDVVNIS